MFTRARRSTEPTYDRASIDAPITMIIFASAPLMLSSIVLLKSISSHTETFYRNISKRCRRRNSARSLPSLVRSFLSDVRGAKGRDGWKRRTVLDCLLAYQSGFCCLGLFSSQHIYDLDAKPSLLLVHLIGVAGGGYNGHLFDKYIMLAVGFALYASSLVIYCCLRVRDGLADKDLTFYNCADDQKDERLADFRSVSQNKRKFD